jgi:hypothetical protein
VRNTLFADPPPSRGRAHSVARSRWRNQIVSASTDTLPPATARVIFDQLTGRRKKRLAVELDEQDRGMGPDALVAVDKRVIENQRVHQRRGLAGQVLVQVFSAERHRRPRHGRFERSLVAKPCGAAIQAQLVGVQGPHLLNRQIPDRHFASTRNASSYFASVRRDASLNRLVTLPPSR